jgi:hypothetical protein
MQLGDKSGTTQDEGLTAGRLLALGANGHIPLYTMVTYAVDTGGNEEQLKPLLGSVK